MANNDNNSDWVLTLVNGIIAGAGAAVAVMSFMLTRFVGLYEGIMGVSTIEVRAGILLGAVVAAAAIGYEVYRKKPVKTQQGIS